jgi:Domain of unknown function (DUF1877)
MACRGWYTGLLPVEVDALLTASDVQDRIELLNSFYLEADQDGRILLVDKSWDAMHRVLSGGWLDFEHGDEVLRACVIGGRRLSDRNTWIMSYVEPNLVQRVSEAIADLTREWFQSLYFGLHKNPPGRYVFRYEADLDEQDFEYTWDYFTMVRDYYQRMAERGLASVFAADQ